MSFVREKPPTPHTSRPIGVTSHTTPLSNRRGVGGEASVNSVCRRPSVGSKRWWKSSVKSVWSVREKNVLRERKTSYASHKQANRGNLTYYAPPCGVKIVGGASCRKEGDHLLSLTSPVLSRNLSLLPT